MIFDFPKLPKAKTDTLETGLTFEQNATLKLIEKENLTEAEIEALDECIAYYKNCFPYLQSIPLSTLKESDVQELEKYMHGAVNTYILIENDISFLHLFRVTKLKEDFLENGKVRKFEYLLPPPPELMKTWGVYNRASSHNQCLFYASFKENTALFEIKPQTSERIIITTWQNMTHKPFISFPIANNETIKNKILEHSTQALKILKTRTNPQLFEIIDQYLLFMSSEFVKNDAIKNQKRYEYFYSAYFGDIILGRNKIITDKIKPKNGKGKTMGRFDCILYPSVAFNHREENLAIAMDSVKQNLRPVKIEEYMVEDVFYETALTSDTCPIKKRLLRTAVNIINDRIIWNDD